MSDEVVVRLAISPALAPAVVDALCREIVRCDEEGNAAVGGVLRGMARQIISQDEARRAALRAWLAERYPGDAPGRGDG